MKDKLIKILKNPGYIFIALSRLGFFKKMNDEKYPDFLNENIFALFTKLELEKR